MESYVSDTIDTHEGSPNDLHEGVNHDSQGNDANPYETLEDQDVSQDNIHKFSPENPPAEPTLEEQRDYYKDQWIRAVAEAENIRKRTLREKEETLRYGALSFARDMLSVADNLNRAMTAMAAEDLSSISPSLKGLIDGLHMIVTETDTVFARHHIKRINPLHETFDAHYHQAMFEIEHPEHPVGTVVQVVQDGYVLHDRLVRPALVGVSKPAAAE